MTPRTSDEISAIASILAGSERAPYPVYDDRFDGVLSLNSGSKGAYGDIVIISDLHIGSGLNPSDNFTGNENFFADAAMARFLDAVNEKRLEIRRLADTGKVPPLENSAPMTLVINGDFIDFLRITDYPDSQEDLDEWLRALRLVNVNSFANTAALDATIEVERRERYGLKTNDFKSVWKLHVASNGHSKVFDALAGWLAYGHRLILTKGNHDLEWFWQPVRNYFRYLLADHMAWQKQIPIAEALQVVLEQVTIVDNAFIMDEMLYVEHGHKYVKMTKLEPDSERLYHSNELNYPLGSYFNRYLLNRLELRYPYFENVRPRESLLPLIIKTDFPLAVKIFWKYIPYLIKTIVDRRAWRVFAPVFSLLLSLLAGLVVIILVIAQFWSGDVDRLVQILSPSVSAKSSILAGIEKYLVSSVEVVAGLGLSYLLSRLLTQWQLTDPSSLYSNSENIFKAYPSVRIATFGHTHDPEQFRKVTSKVDGTVRWYYNTGTWIPIVDTTTGNLREDKTYTYLYFTHDTSGAILPHPLHRWDDSASRGETLTLMEIKEG